MKDNCDIQTEKTTILTFPDVKAILVHAILMAYMYMYIALNRGASGLVYLMQGIFHNLWVNLKKKW